MSKKITPAELKYFLKPDLGFTHAFFHIWYLLPPTILFGYYFQHRYLDYPDTWLTHFFETCFNYLLTIDWSEKGWIGLVLTYLYLLITCINIKIQQSNYRFNFLN
jgi:hypothetical protein